MCLKCEIWVLILNGRGNIYVVLIRKSGTLCVILKNCLYRTEVQKDGGYDGSKKECHTGA